MWNKVAKIPRMSKSLLISKLQEIRSENFLQILHRWLENTEGESLSFEAGKLPRAAIPPYPLVALVSVDMAAICVI